MVLSKGLSVDSYMGLFWNLGDFTFYWGFGVWDLAERVWFLGQRETQREKERENLEIFMVKEREYEG